MTIGKLGGAPAPFAAQPRTSFRDVLARSSENPSQPTAAPRPAPFQATPAELAERVQRAQLQMEQVLRQAQTGRSFSPAELLCLQVRISDAAQVIDFTGKAVDKALGAVKQVLQTQV